METWLKKSDRLILLVGVTFILIAVISPYFSSFIDQVFFSPGRKTDGQEPIYLQEVTISTPDIVVGSEKINLNRATPDDLQNLDGIGPVLAGRIVEFREENGPFTSIHDLADIDGIGSEKLAGIEGSVYITEQ